MHRLFAKQLARATDASGTLDIARLAALVGAAYDEGDRDRRRVDRAMALMADELATANARLEQLVVDLRIQSSMFETAVENIPLGIAMYDPGERLVVANARLCEVMGLPAGSLPVGIRFEEALVICGAAGHYGSVPADQVYRSRRSVFADRVGYQVEEVRGGRIISVIAHPMADGGAIITFEDLTERREAEARVEHMAWHDALTGLANRTQLRARLEQAMVRAHRGEVFALHCLDLDRFKAVNDTLGHPVGDDLLRAVTQRMRETVRPSDLVARLGGDEFAILQGMVGQPQEVEALAGRIVDALSRDYEIQGHRINISASIGVALAPQDGASPDVLMKQADLALYRAKAEGRGTWRFFEPEMDAQMQSRRVLELELRQALAASAFELYYQPLVDVASGRIIAFEALIRWHHPQRGLVAPDEFIPLAEETGLIVQLGEWVVKRACVEAASWPRAISIAVNFSAVQFRSPRLVDSVAEALAQSGLAAERLEIEVTESILLEDNARTLATLHRLRDLGARISMDDFGTGYSSLSYLRSFPFDKLKIDQSFVRDLELHGDAQAIVRAISGLGGSLCMRTTAEGVETQEQLDRLRADGCTEAQGYLFGKPMPAGDAAALLAQERERSEVIALPRRASA